MKSGRHPAGVENLRKAYSYIRFSTPEQLKGDSLRRQLELSRTYAREHQLQLDESLNLRDFGVSAYRGKNRTQGALAIFLRAVEARRIPAGAFLLVESLDRLSRAQITEALTTFLQIINAGITVVTLTDELSYSKESLDQNMGNLMMSLVIMARAHDESATKSRRLSAAWKGKREVVSERKLTAQAPAWLRLSEDRKTFETIPDRVAVVQRIFTLSEQGFGKRSIAQLFNREGITPWGRGKRRGRGWHDSYVQKILSNRAVIGKFQPHRLVDGKRVPEGEPLSDYFPTIIDSATFQRVNARPPRAPGPVGDRVSNLFTGVIFDGYTGAPMRFVNKGTKKRGNDRWKYLTTDQRRIDPSAAPCSWNYRQFEELVLRFIQELDWRSVLREGGTSADDAHERAVVALTERAEALRCSIGRIVKAIETTSDIPDALVARLGSLEAEQREVEVDLERKQRLLENRRQADAEMMQKADSLNALAVKAVDTATRLRLREEIRRKIKRIDLYPKGLQREWRNAEYAVAINSSEPILAVSFPNGVTRWVISVQPRPQALTLQQAGDGDAMRWTLGPIPDGAYVWKPEGPVPKEVLAALGRSFG